jgi:transcriptional regulator with XRE-family HTH domain
MNTLPPLTLPHRLRIAREHAHLEQHQLATALGVSRNTISRWETGSHPPSLGMVRLWAIETQVDLQWLLGEIPAPTIPAVTERRRGPRTTGRPTIGEARWYPRIPALELLRLRRLGMTVTGVLAAR